MSRTRGQVFIVNILAGTAAGLLLAGQAGGLAATKSAGAAGNAAAEADAARTPADHNNLGVKFGTAGNWPAALREHEKAVQMEPRNQRWRMNLSAAHLQFALALAKRGKKSDAAIEFRKAMVIDPFNAEADAELDKLLRSEGKDPDSFAVRSQLAEAAEKAGQYDTAIVEWRRCVRLKNTGLSHAHLGKVFVNAGKIKEGYKELTVAVSKADWSPADNRELADTHRQLGDILKDAAHIAMSNGNTTKGMQRLSIAAIEFRRAVTLCPGNGAAIEGLLHCAQTALTVKPSFENHLFLGGVYMLAGKFSNAEMEYRECAKLQPRSMELFQAWKNYYRTIATSPLSSTDQSAANVPGLKAFIDAHAGDADLWFTLGLIRERQSQFDKAEKCFAKARSINPALKHDVTRPAVNPSASAPDTATGTTQDSQKTTTQLYNDLENLLDSQSYDDVIIKAQELFKKYPREGCFPGIIGRAYSKKGELPSAKVWLRIGGGLGDARAQKLLEQLETAPQVQPKEEPAQKPQDQLKIEELKPVKAKKEAGKKRKKGDLDVANPSAPAQNASPAAPEFSPGTGTVPSPLMISPPNATPVPALSPSTLPGSTSAPAASPLPVPEPGSTAAPAASPLPVPAAGSTAAPAASPLPSPMPSSTSGPVASPLSLPMPSAPASSPLPVLSPGPSNLPLSNPAVPASTSTPVPVPPAALPAANEPPAPVRSSQLSPAVKTTSEEAKTNPQQSVPVPK